MDTTGTWLPLVEERPLIRRQNTFHRIQILIWNVRLGQIIPSLESAKNLAIGTIIGVVTTWFWAALSFRVSEKALRGDAWQRELDFRMFCEGLEDKESTPACLKISQQPVTPPPHIRHRSIVATSEDVETSSGDQYLPDFSIHHSARLREQLLSNNSHVEQVTTPVHEESRITRIIPSFIILLSLMVVLCSASSSGHMRRRRASFRMLSAPALPLFRDAAMPYAMSSVLRSDAYMSNLHFGENSSSRPLTVVPLTPIEVEDLYDNAHKR
ncbi:hypothetical protein BZA77DRAFT_360526 [Pyronema omphalodes]|nr:hypothetical protein BZA77DRAFT_360526 [Pyronema omphalodes]